MSGEMKVGVELNLKDNLSKGFNKASKSGTKFSKKMLSSAEKLNKAFSGVAGTLGTIGVSMGAAATINKTIEFEDKLTRLGTTAGASSDQIRQLKKEIFAASMLPDIKMNPDEIANAMNVIMEKTGNLDFATANIKNMGRAMQALSLDGSTIGALFAEYDKLGKKTEEITMLLDGMYVQGNKGAFTAAEFAKNGSAIISAYSKIGTSSKDLLKANAAMQILTMGTKDPTAAVTVLENLMQELADPSKQEKLAKLGKSVGMNLNVRDANGQFRDLTELLPKIVEAGQKLGNMDQLGTIFGGTTIKGITAFETYGDKLEGLLKLGDTTGATSKASAKNAATLKSNIQNLQTAFTAFANAGLEKPLIAVTNALNKLAENPQNITKFFKALSLGLGSVVAIKGLSKVVGTVSKISNFVKNRKYGGGASMSSIEGAAGATPVFVTNMPDNFGGRASSGYDYERQNKKSKKGRKKRSSTRGNRSSIRGAAGGAAITTALFAIPNMIRELKDINNDDELKGKEKSKAQGGAIGETAGSIIGAAGGVAAGATAGALAGSVVPILGTAVGAIVGAGVGLAGRWLGKKVGEKIGEVVGKDEPIPGSEAIKQELATVPQAQAQKTKALVEGAIAYEEHVYIHDDRVEVKRKQVKNTTPFTYNTGNIKQARGIMY